MKLEGNFPLEYSQDHPEWHALVGATRQVMIYIFQYDVVFYFYPLVKIS